MTHGIPMDIGIVREFGNAIRAGHGATLNDPIIKDILEKDMNKTKKLLSYLRHVTYIEEFHTLEGPTTDYLIRYKNFAWYGQVASPGYDAFEEHFKCHKEHIPEHPTLEYIQKMIVRYAENLKEDGTDD